MLWPKGMISLLSSKNFVEKNHAARRWINVLFRPGYINTMSVPSFFYSLPVSSFERNKYLSVSYGGQYLHLSSSLSKQDILLLELLFQNIDREKTILSGVLTSTLIFDEVYDQLACTGIQFFYPEILFNIGSFVVCMQSPSSGSYSFPLSSGYTVDKKEITFSFSLDVSILFFASQRVIPVPFCEIEKYGSPSDATVSVLRLLHALPMRDISPDGILLSKVLSSLHLISPYSVEDISKEILYKNPDNEENICFLFGLYFDKKDRKIFFLKDNIYPSSPLVGASDLFSSEEDSVIIAPSESVSPDGESFSSKPTSIPRSR